MLFRTSWNYIIAIGKIFSAICVLLSSDNFTGFLGFPEEFYYHLLSYIAIIPLIKVLILPIDNFIKLRTYNTIVIVIRMILILHWSITFFKSILLLSEDAYSWKVRCRMLHRDRRFSLIYSSAALRDWFPWREWGELPIGNLRRVGDVSTIRIFGLWISYNTHELTELLKHILFIF